MLLKENMNKQGLDLHIITPFRSWDFPMKARNEERYNSVDFSFSAVLPMLFLGV